jgi:AraC-like DNA-binding protein
MDFKFQLFPVKASLAALVEKIWYFEAPGKLPGDDLKLIVPNGRPLMLLPCRNALLSRMDNRNFSAAENNISLVGVCDTPSVIDSQDNGPTASIGLEFSPAGFYRFFEMPASEFKNDLNSVTDILGKEAAILEKQIQDIAEPAEKVIRLQTFLASMLNNKCRDSLFDYCIRQIELTKGAVSIKQLEKITGYSSRWLNMKFKDHLGMSPKNFSSIIRFQHYYKVITGNTGKPHLVRARHNAYYDESHFIKDFKRFTGMTPSRIQDLENKFGSLFY